MCKQTVFFHFVYICFICNFLKLNVLNFALEMCGNRISVRFRFLKPELKPKLSQNQKFPWLFSKSNLSRTNSQYLSHSHKALTFFTLWTQSDSKWSWNKIISWHHAIIHAFETNWAFRKPSTKMQNAHTRKTVYTFMYFTTDLQRKENRTDGFFQNRNQNRNPRFFLKPNRTWKIHSAHPYFELQHTLSFIDVFHTRITFF